MTSLTLRRVISSPRGTFGVLLMDGDPICVTCEDPWNGNATGKSCIPAGHYRCKAHNGKHYRNVWEVTNVPGRTGILLHNGNTINDTLGCILVGDGFGKLNGMPGVLNSVATLNKLRKLLPPEFDLTIS